MRKILNIGGNDVAFESNAATPIFYKSEFKSDYFVDMMRLSKAMQDAKDIKQLSYEDLDHVDLNVLSQFAWACAKSADRNIKPYLDWLIDNPDFDIFDHGTEIVSLINQNSIPKKK